MSVRTLSASFCFLAACAVGACNTPPAGSCDPPLTKGHIEKIEAGERCGGELAACRAAAQAEAAPDDALPAEAPEVEIKIGVMYALGQGNQTVVMNPKPVEDGLRRFAKGAVCRFDPEGTVKVIARHQLRSEDGDADIEYLVRYTRDPAPEALKEGALEYPDSEPYECPTGTVFFLDDVSILEAYEPDSRFEDARKLLDSEKH